MKKIRYLIKRILIVLKRDFNDSLWTNLVFLKRKLFSRFHIMLIEPINVCNIKCPLCPTPPWKNGRVKQIMKGEDFQKIINNIDLNIPRIYLTLGGEPLMNNELFEFVRIAKKHHYKISLSTNGVLFADENIRKNIIESKIDQVIISFDGFSKETYESVREGADFESVFSGINLLLDEKERAKDKKYYEVQYIQTSMNENETLAAKAHFESKGAHFHTKSLSLVEYSLSPEELEQYSKWLPSKKESKNRYRDVKKKQCSLPVDSLTIFVDGEVGVCCVDYQEKNKYGTLLERSLSSVLNSEKYRKDYELAIKRDLGICQNCNVGY